MRPQAVTRRKTPLDINIVTLQPIVALVAGVLIEARHAAAREIALALGVPPMLLGIPGDNTYSNYLEASRSFWRQTVLPLVNRTAKALSGWLGPAYGGGLELKPDLDQIEALAAEREALWMRLGKAEFLTDDEKRAAVGYGPKSSGA